MRDSLEIFIERLYQKRRHYGELISFIRKQTGYSVYRAKLAPTSFQQDKLLIMDILK